VWGGERSRIGGGQQKGRKSCDEKGMEERGGRRSWKKGRSMKMRRPPFSR